MLRRSLGIVLLLACCVSPVTHFAYAQTPGPAPPSGAASPATPPQATDAPTTPQPAAAPEESVEAPLPKVAAPKLEELLQPVGEIATAIDAAEKDLEQPPGGQKELADFRSRVEKLEFRAKEAGEALQPRLDEVRSQIAKLGAAPAADAPPEAPEVAAERDRLNQLAAQIDGAIKKAALVEVRAKQLVSRIQHVRQGIFTRFLLRQTESPLQPAVWHTSAEQLGVARQKIAFVLSNWWSIARWHWLAILGVLAAALAAYAVLRVIVGHFMRARLGTSAPTEPSLHRRAAEAVWVTAAFALPPIVAALVVYAGLDELGLLYWQVERFAQAFLYAFIILVAICALARAVMQPRRPLWRLFDLDDTSAARVILAVQAIAGVYALEFLLRSIASILSLPHAFDIASAFVASLILAALILLLARTPFAPRVLAPGAPVSRSRPLWLKALLVALAGAVLVTALLGYVELSRFIAGEVLMTGSCVLLVALLHLAIQGLRPTPAAVTEGMPPATGPWLKVDEVGRERMLGIARLLLNAALLAISVPLILLAWGASGAEILSLLRGTVAGFEIGGVQVSLVRILLAVVLFFVLLTLTRLFQRWLTARARAQTQWDPGLVNSVYTGAGYIGFAVALLVAVAYAGFDITNLAIVAGALSVGIGFGLQGIVNNFVSGLVLLIERPIKVGDWIATREGEGYVRRISVRATEIETFDRASLIVPNSELVTQTVTNLTLRNQLGRLNIAVRVAYAADPELAQRVLQKVADANTSILRHPAPMVVLDNLGDQALEYTVRVYLVDINRSLQVQTEIRIEIVKALRAAGIDIPYFAVQVGHASGPHAAPDHVSVRISVAPSADPDAVLDALAAAARGCPEVSEGAEPDVAFDNAGASGLEFSVSAPLAEGADVKRAETSLRTAIVRTLRRRGVALASPEQGVPARDLESLRTLLRQLGEETARAPQQEQGHEPK
jgi:potassium-dependent mechanosensitive channel